MKMEQSVPKRRLIKFRRRGITQKKAYNTRSLVKLRRWWTIENKMDIEGVKK
jgi:hypothetical protein